MICGNNWKEGRFSDTYTELYATRPLKLVALAIATEMQDQTQTQKGIYSDGRTLVRIKLLGICMRT